MNLRLITLSVLIAFILSISLAVSPSDSIPPFQYDFGVRARGTANPLNGQCDLRYASELTSPISISKLYYSTDGQNSWSNVNAILDEGDRYTAATPSIAGDAHWRFYFESAETWGGQTPVYTGTSTCRLPINYYTMWDDPAGIDSSAYGGGDWLDIIKAGFCVSSTRFYGIIIKTNSDYRETDGESWGGIVDLYDDNYGYLFSINNPAVPTSNVFYSIAKCRAANPPDIGGGSVELAPGILKVVDMSNIYAIGDAEIVVVAETMFVSCLISDLTGDADFGTWPNDKRYLNVSAQTMHLHIWGYIWALNTHFYMADEMKNGHAYYKNPIAEWKSSPSAPNTPPVLTGPYVNYDAGLDITEVGITYQDADENPPEYVNLDILGRVTYHLQKDQIEGPYGWITGIWYSAEIPGYHGFGADFTFVASDGIDEFILPAGPMYVDSAERPELAKLVSVSPNPFNSVCKIEAPVGARVEIFDIRGSFVDAFNIADQSGEQYWQPSGDVTSGVYYIKATYGKESLFKKAVFMK